MSKPAVLPCLLLALCAARVGADPAPSGRVFRVSSCLTCLEHNPVVAGSSNGDFIAVWDEIDPNLRAAVAGRPFSAAARPLAVDFEVVQAPTPPPQTDVTATSDAGGNFILAWVTEEDGNSVVMAQRFSAGGSALAPALVVASDPAPSTDSPADSKPAVAQTPDGGFAVVWVSLAPGSDSPSTSPRIMAQRFGADGAPGFPSAVQLNTGLADGGQPSLCVDRLGRMDVAWTFADAFRPFQANLVGVALRRLGQDGTPLGPEMVVSPALASGASVAVSCGKRNSFVVAWSSDQRPASVPAAAASGFDVYAQRFRTGGRPFGSPVVVNSHLSGDQLHPAVTHDAQGNFVIVWESNAPGNTGVFGKEFDFFGSSLSAEFAVHTTTQPDPFFLRPRVAAVGSQGSLAVVWDGADGLFGQLLNETSAASGQALAALGPGGGEEGAGAAARSAEAHGDAVSGDLEER